MGRTKKTPEQIVIDSWIGTRYEHSMFKNKSDDFFIGWAAAMLQRDNLNSELSSEQWVELITNLLSVGKLK
jgi:hypothetical protein